MTLQEGHEEPSFAAVSVLLLQAPSTYIGLLYFDDQSAILHEHGDALRAMIPGGICASEVRLVTPTSAAQKIGWLKQYGLPRGGSSLY